MRACGPPCSGGSRRRAAPSPRPRSRARRRRRPLRSAAPSTRAPARTRPPARRNRAPCAAARRAPRGRRRGASAQPPAGWQGGAACRAVAAAGRAATACVAGLVGGAPVGALAVRARALAVPGPLLVELGLSGHVVVLQLQHGLGRQAGQLRALVQPARGARRPAVSDPASETGLGSLTPRFQHARQSKPKPTGLYIDPRPASFDMCCVTRRLERACNICVPTGRPGGRPNPSQHRAAIAPGAYLCRSPQW